MKKPFDYEYGETEVTSVAKRERHEGFLFSQRKVRHRATGLQQAVHRLRV